ncbi:MAG: hypothetical protein V4736_14065, partial [Bdellovibrionota bacterium]
NGQLAVRRMMSATLSGDPGAGMNKAGESIAGGFEATGQALSETVQVPVKAAEVYEYQRPIRALGMGGVYIPFVSDTDAPYVNPAALAYVEAISWKVFSLDFGAGIAGFSNPTDVQSLTTPTTAADYIQFFGKKVTVNAFGASTLTLPYFGISFFDELYSSAVMHTPAFPALNAKFINDYGGVIATGFPIAPLISAGIAVKRINRWGGSQTLGLGSLAEATSFTNNFADKGIGHGIDGALMFRAPMLLQPTLALVWKDVGDTSFVMTEGTAPPEAIKSNLAAAFGSKLDLPGLDISAGLEYRHIMNNTLQLGQKLHIGGEISLPMIDLRAGLYQGYPSYGVGLDLLLLQFNAAYYGIETGGYPGQSRMDRVQVGVQMEFSLDANFNFYDKNGKRRKIRQRR